MTEARTSTVIRFDRVRLALAAGVPPELDSPADLVYVLQTTVPAHWIPLVAVRDPRNTEAVVLQRGTLLTQDGSARPTTAQGVLLEPDV